MKKFLKFVFLAFALVLVVPQVSFAEEGVEGVEGELPEDEENIELGESIRVEGELSDPQMQAMAAHRSVTVISGPKKINKRVKYLTESWAKASSYTWSKSISSSSTISSSVGISAGAISSSLGISNSITTSFNVGMTLPASKSKYSKLAFYGDYNQRYVRVRLYNTQGLLYSDKKTYHDAPRKDTYLQVVYK
ncbi:hypothetical protein ABFY54_30315 [Priestia megaterium]|uniref:hypothetical protein n=1 Tax=Priestia TaxID=2800373 RepID=UPI00301CA752